MARRSIRGSRAIITGASSGIGRELSAELARRGARLVVVARREERLRALVERIDGAGGEAEMIVGDVTDPATREAALHRAQSVFGGLDLLVNNAGVGALGHFQNGSPERLLRIMEVNFFAPVEMIRAALPLLRQGRAPMVVNVGSILGHRGIPLNSEYCASKFALRGFSEAVRAEFAHLGIDVLTVSPGTTETDFFASYLEQTDTPRYPQRGAVSPLQVARKTARAIERGTHEIIPSGLGRLLVYLNRLSPRLLDRVMRRYG